MASIFWDSQGVIMVDYLEEGCTINGAYCAEELRQLHQEIWRKEEESLLRVFWSYKIIHQPIPLKLLWLLRLNAASRSLLNHPLHSPDLALSDFSLFPIVKANLRDRNFGSNEGKINAVDEYLGDQVEGFYFEGMSKLEQHWRKCIETKGDYIDKWWHNFCSWSFPKYRGWELFDRPLYVL